MKLKSNLFPHLSVMFAALAAMLCYLVDIRTCTCDSQAARILIPLLLTCIAVNMLIFVIEDILKIKWEKNNKAKNKKSR